MDYTYYLTFLNRTLSFVKDKDKRNEQNLLLIKKMEENGDYKRTEEIYRLYIEILRYSYFDSPISISDTERGVKVLYHLEEFFENYGFDFNMIKIYISVASLTWQYDRNYNLLLKLYEIPEFKEFAIIKLGDEAFSFVGIITRKEMDFFYKRSNDLKAKFKRQNCAEIKSKEYSAAFLNMIYMGKKERTKDKIKEYVSLFINTMEKSGDYNKTKDLYNIYINALIRYYNCIEDIASTETGGKLMYHIEQYLNRYAIDLIFIDTSYDSFIDIYLSVAARTRHYERGYNLLLKLYNTPGFRDFAVIELGNRAIEYRRAGLIAEEKCYSLIERRDALKAEYGI